MITYVKKQYTKEEVLRLLDPLIAKWFDAKFSSLTEPQAYTIPLIHQRRNVLVSSPTGSGKTLTAFLSIINELYIAHKTGKLEDKIYCVYVSPLKALANDINKNLKEPLAEIQELARKEGLEPPEIRVAVRSGDTTNYERQKMARKPPHIFITTPESLSLVLSTPKFSTNFTGVQYVIIDEIHEISNSKRGVFLSLTLERLQNYVKQPFVRIGLSATQAPIEMIAKFLVGYQGKQMRDVDIIQASRTKDLDLSVVCPVTDMTTLPYEVVNWKMYDLLSDLIGKHRTTLVFTNTRSGTENIVYKLKEKGLEKVAAHHGSLSRETRLEVEELLRNGNLKCVVSSTSLELGIDIGHIDLVCQIGSPKSVAKGLQRIGRSGHGVLETSKGRMIVMDKDDLVETAVLTKKAHEGEIDRIDILQGSKDVLAQSIIGMALEEKWDLDDAYDLISRAYCYHNTTQEEFMDVVEYLAGKYKSHDGGYGRIWLDPDSGTFGAKKGTRMMFYLNLGTIPEEANYRVLSSSGPLGNLSEKFVERLGKGDVFVLGGRTYEFQKTRAMSVFVKDAQGRRPTVPSWSGEMLPRSFDLSVGIGAFRRTLEEKLGVTSAFAGMAGKNGKDREKDGGKGRNGKKGKNKGKAAEELVPKTGLKVHAPAAAAVEALRKEADEAAIKAWLMKDYHLDAGSATTILNYFWEQATFGPIPTDRHLILEGYADQTGAYNIIFHFCFGRRVNDALSRAYAHAIGEEVGGNVRISLTDDDFMLTVPRPVDLTKIVGLVSAKNLEERLRGALKGTELFRQRFRHCAMRGFMILRNYKGREIPVSRQVRHSSRILSALPDEEFPIVAETYDEILKDHMDLEHAAEVLKDIGEGKMDVEIRDFFDTPSPFAHNVVMIGASDIIMLEDRSSLLRELHQQVLERVMADMPAPAFSMADVKRFFEAKVVDIRDKDDILDLLRIMGPMNIFQDKGESIYRHSAHDHDTLRRWAMELVAEGRVVSVWRNGTLWCAADQASIYKALHAKNGGVGAKDKKVLRDLVAEDGGGPWKPEATVVCAEGPPAGHGDVFGDDEVAEAAPVGGLDEGDEDGGLGMADDTAGTAKPVGMEKGKVAEGKTVRKGKARGKGKKDKAEKEAEVAARKKLERAFMMRMDRLGADGEPLWSEDGTKPADFDDALRHVIRNALEYRSPMTLEEMSYTLALPENILESLLKEMTNEVIPIHIDGAKRYIQIKDKVRMENTKVKAFDDRTVRGFLLEKHFDQTKDVADFFVRFPEANMLMDVYNRVKEFSIDQWWTLRQSGQVLEGRFVRGRVGYMAGHLAALYSLLVPRTEMRPVDKATLEAIDGAKAGSMTLQEIAKLLGNKYSREVLRDSVDSLDRALRIVRAFSERKEWPSRNRYMPYHPKAPTIPSGSNPAREVVIRAIEAYGPLTLNQIRHHTNLSFDELNRIISELENGHVMAGPGGEPLPAGTGGGGGGNDGDGAIGGNGNGNGYAASSQGGGLSAKPGDGGGGQVLSAAGTVAGASNSVIGKPSKAAATAAAIAEEAPVTGSQAHATSLPIQRIAVVGSNAGQVEMFITASDLEALEKSMGGASAGAGKDPSDGIRVLSQMDPYASRFWIEVTRRYGEGWYHVIMKDGEPVGRIEIWNLSGSVEVRDLVLDDEALLGELLDELDEVCGFFEVFGIDIIRVRGAYGKDVTELSAGTVRTFRSHGYIEVQGMLVKGNILQRTFPKNDVMLYLFHKQRLTEDNRFGDTMEALKATGGLHSEFEVDLRVKRFFPLRRYENEATACLAIPEYHTYVPNELLGLLKKAKNRHLDENMTKILELLKHYGTLTRKELSQKMSIPQAEFNDALKALYSGLHILKNTRSMFYINASNGMAVEEARSNVMWRIIENFGMISAEVLASYTKHEFKMGEIRDRLRRWEAEGKLVKGFLVDGDDALYWMLAKDVETVGKHTYKGIMVLTSMDPLVQYLAEEIRGRFGIGTCHVVFNGPEMIGAFKATRHKGVLSYHKVVGDELVVQSIKAFGRRWGLKVQRKEDAESEEKAEEEDWEIIQWYEKKKKME